MTQRSSEAALIAADDRVEGSLGSLVDLAVRASRGFFRTSDAIIGDNVSAISADWTTTTVTVTPNSRKRRPTIPLMNRSGMKTATSETVMETIVMSISFEPIEGRCFSILALLHVPENIFQHDDRVVDDQPHGERPWVLTRRWYGAGGEGVTGAV
jgi:hypothetical protein